MLLTAILPLLILYCPAAAAAADVRGNARILLRRGELSIVGGSGAMPAQLIHLE